MADIVTIHTAKRTLSLLIARAEAGEEIVIVRGRIPVAKLVAIHRKTTKRQFGSLRGKAVVGPEFFEPLSESELKRWK